MQTEITPEGLKVPKFDGSYNKGKGRDLESKLDVRSPLLQELFEPEELRSLLVVKIKKDAPDSHLVGRIFSDGIRRELAFNSGENYYFADDELRREIKEFFATEADTAGRYGSLLTSSCLNGTTTESNIRLKIVDDTDPAERQKWEINDCHGKISPQLAQQFGGEVDRALQFRLGWRRRNAVPGFDSPKKSFIAKGTFLPDATLTDELGYDIILPFSSIKPSALKDYIPCGDYVCPKLSFGNRENSSIGLSHTSYQVLMGLSKETIAADFGSSTRRKSEKLASIQSLQQTNPLALTHYLVADHEKQQQHRKKKQTGAVIDSEEITEDSQSDDENKQSHRMIELLKSDRYGLLLNSPKVAEFVGAQFAGKFRDLAVRSGYLFTSGLALPCEDLVPGEISARHLPMNETIIFDRHPILNKDGICKVTNVPHLNPKLAKYKGIIWVSAEEYLLNQQPTTDFEQLGGDYDGDKANTAPARDLPNTANEIRFITEPGEYVAVQKLPKLAYTDPHCRDRNGKPYKKLRQIAIACANHSTGLLCSAIGRVETSMPAPNENPRKFEREKQKLLARLHISAKTEVDYGKSALRFTDLETVTVDACPKLFPPEKLKPGQRLEIEVDGKFLLDDVKAWGELHPAPFFDYYKDDRLYKTIALPTDHQGSLEVLAERFVNPIWEPTRIRHLEKHEFLNLVPEPIGLEPDETDDAAWDDYLAAKEVWEQYLDWAKDLRDRVNQSRRDIAELCTDENSKFDRDRFVKEVSALYQSIKQEIDQELTDAEDRRWAFAANWRVQHARPNLETDRKHCLAIAKTLSTTFRLESDYQIPTEIESRERYVLSVPFGTEAERWKSKLDKASIEYEAVINEHLPMVDFVLKHPSRSNCRKLESKFGDHFNELSEIELPDELDSLSQLRIVPPAPYTWAHHPNPPSKAALAYVLFPEELNEHLQNYQVEQIQVWGIAHNDFAEVDFTKKSWRKPQQFEVKAFDAAERLGTVHPQYDTLDGRPVLTIADQYLGTFSPLTAKLPIGTIFTATIHPNGSAVDLKVAPNSVCLPETPDFSNDLKPATPKRDRWETFLQDRIAEAYTNLANQGKAQRIEAFPVGEDWTARVLQTGDFVIENNQAETVYSANFNTGKVRQHLSAQTIDQLDQKMNQQIRKQTQVKKIPQTAELA